jgi:hypothetical protein
MKKARGNMSGSTARRRPQAAPEGEPATGEAGPPPLLEESVVIVSGLPRSGTSMIMQMLAAGGVRVLTDGVCAADEHNPRGYLGEQNLDEILNSHAQTLLRRNKNLPDTPERWDRLKENYALALRQVKAFLRSRPATALLVLERSEVLHDPAAAALQIVEVDTSPHRQRGLRAH